MIGVHHASSAPAANTASLAGLPIGKGSWAIDIGDAQYTAAASGMTTGLIRVFVGGRGSGAAQGTLSGGKPVSSNYSATIKSGHHTDEIRVSVADGTVKDFKIEPPIEPNPKRVPLTEGHRHGVMDPMTASLILMPGTGDMRGDLPIKQRGFQEVDTVALMKPITKAAFLVKDVADLPNVLEEAFCLARESADADEGIAAFREKLKPQFEGR